MEAGHSAHPSLPQARGCRHRPLRHRPDVRTGKGPELCKMNQILSSPASATSLPGLLVQICPPSASPSPCVLLEPPRRPVQDPPVLVPSPARSRVAP